MDDKHYKGILKSWEDDRGFGFIATERSDVFFHVSGLKDSGQRPRAGDVLHYQLHRGNDGKVRAVNVRIEDRNPRRPVARGSRVPRHGEKRRWPGQLAFFALLLAAIGVWGYLQRTPQTVAKITWSDPASTAPVINVVPTTPRTRSAQFSCSGKVYCSQMNSCAEARFYLRNCPGTKMDGDHDGIPCERQWCN